MFSSLVHRPQFKKKKRKEIYRTEVASALMLKNEKVPIERDLTITAEHVSVKCLLYMRLQSHLLVEDILIVLNFKL